MCGGGDIEQTNSSRLLNSRCQGWVCVVGGGDIEQANSSRLQDVKVVRVGETLLSYVAIQCAR